MSRPELPFRLLNILLIPYQLIPLYEYEIWFVPCPTATHKLAIVAILLLFTTIEPQVIGFNPKLAELAPDNTN